MTRGAWGLVALLTTGLQETASARLLLPGRELSQAYTGVAEPSDVGSDGVSALNPVPASGMAVATPGIQAFSQQAAILSSLPAATPVVSAVPTTPSLLPAVTISSARLPAAQP